MSRSTLDEVRAAVDRELAKTARTNRIKAATAVAVLVAWVATAILALSLAWWVVLGDATGGTTITQVDIPDGTAVSCTVQNDRLAGCAVDLPQPPARRHL